jgi:hypothetical protein
MQVSSRKVETTPKFEPFELVLRFERAEEVAAIFAIFQYSPACNAVHDWIAHEEIRNALRMGGQDPVGWSDFHGRICRNR